MAGCNDSVGEPDRELDSKIIQSNKPSKTASHTSQLCSKMIEALSPSGNMYETLWPIIIEQASSRERNYRLRLVNTFFDKIVRRINSDDLYYAIEEHPFHNQKPVSLNPEAMQGTEWQCWGGKRLEFGSVEDFRDFCALGDVDPEEGASQYDAKASFNAMLGITPTPRQLSWIFLSRTGDVIFETSLHNPNEDAYAHYFGITGRADKVKRMFEFFIKIEGMSYDELDFGARGFI